MSKKTISAVIPCRNQEDKVDDTINHIISLAKKLDDFEVEIVFVNDRSTDKSAEVAEKCLKNYPNSQILHTDPKYVGNGKGLAVELGMIKAKGDYRLFMDADNSTKFEEVKKFIPYFDKYDVILGTRYSDKTQEPSNNWFKAFYFAIVDVFQVIIYGHAKRYIAKKKQGRLREFVSRGGNLAFTVLLGQSFTDSRCGFKMYSKKASEKIFPLCKIKTWDFDTEALVLAKRFKYKMLEVPVNWYDDEAASNFKIKDMIDAFKAIFQVYFYTLRGGAIEKNKKNESFVDRIIVFLKNNWILLLILAVATFLRFYQLDKLPPGLYPDEAANGQDIIRMMDEGDHRAIYDTNGPRESLFFYAQGLFVWIGKTFNIDALNFTPLALRISPAIIGILTVWGVYLMGKEFTNKKVIGLLAAGAMAVSAWHVQFSRNGFRAIMLPLALSFMFYFFIKAYREGKLKDYLMFATFLAMGFYTYLSIRMAPLTFAALFVWFMVFDKKFIKKNIKKLIYTGTLFLLLLVPLFISFAGDITLLAGRASTSIFNPEFNNGSPLMTFLDNIWKEIKMFNISGDENFRHNLGGSPMLDMVTGIFFWIGAFFTLWNWKKIEHFTLIVLFGVMSLPMILTAEGIPHALRIVGVMPVIFIWIGVGIEFVANKINDKKIQYGLMTAIILIAGILGFKKYFIDFPLYVEAREAYTEDMVQIAWDLRDSPEDRENILITGEFGTKTVDYMVHVNQPKWYQMETYEIKDQFKLPRGKYKIYIQESWKNDAEKAFLESGYWFNFTPVKSEVDGRVIYYEYENK